MAAEIRVNGSVVQPGEPRALFDSAYVNLNHPGGNYHTFAVSSDGQRFLIPRPDLSTLPNSRLLTLYDRNGKTVGTIGRAGLYNQPVFSPDRTRVAVIRLDPEKGNQDIWVIDVATGEGHALTSTPPDKGVNRGPV
jgi:Tol biopolymer transport system component